jgi:putative CocE/NonD family hydrolase
VQRWHLRSGGALSLEAPGSEPADSFRYDPADPAPTVGGAHMAYGITETGVRDQRELEDRTDVLVYTSAHLLEPLAVVGPVAVEVFVRSSAPTIDLVATLVDVTADGKALNIADGVQRTATADGSGQAVTIDLKATAYTVPAGHRLRVHVTSSSFPRLERSPHAAVVHVLHDQDHPSAITLAIPEVAK